VLLVKLLMLLTEDTFERAESIKSLD